VRPATQADLPWLTEHDGHLGAERIAAKVAGREVLVAEVDGVPAGMLRLDHLWSAVPYMALVRVLAPFRRQGVGRALVGAVCEHAREMGADFVLSSATGDEPEPQAWHRAVGFEPCGELSGINPGGVGEVFFRLPV